MPRTLAIVLVAACGGSPKPAASPAGPPPGAVAGGAADPCAAAYGEYERTWRIARSEELAEVEFEPAAITEVVNTEVAMLPKKADLAKLRGQYTAVAIFLPDAAWPVALDAADHAVAQCGEGAKRP